MKKIILLITMLCAVNLHAGLLGTLGNDIDKSGLLTATNYAFEGYATFARSAPNGRRWGGGLLAVYNVNQNVGLALGGDYLGRFTLVSGNATLQLPLQPLKTFTILPAWAQNVTVSPFVLGGLGRPLSGTSSDVATIEDVGAYVRFGHLLGGTFNTGYCHGRWDNAGKYSGERDHLFLGWSLGF